MRNRTEVISGLATVLSMLYIVFLVPALMGDAGQNTIGMVQSAILVCSLGSVLFSLVTKLPFAVGPGIVHLGIMLPLLRRGEPLSVVLGICAVAGILFTLLAVSGLLKRISSSIPSDLKTVCKFAIGMYFIAVAIIAGGAAKDSFRFFSPQLTTESVLFLSGVAVIPKRNFVLK